jgi:hypothetical protein
MQYTSVAVLALAATAYAGSNNTIAYTTEVHTAYTTVCPASTELTFNGVTYTATASTTLTITNCPCTIVKPITTSAVVVPTSAPIYANTTAAGVPTTAAGVPTTAVGTTSAKVSATPSSLPASGANKAVALSGASLAGLLGLAAYIL